MMADQRVVSRDVEVQTDSPLRSSSSACQHHRPAAAKFTRKSGEIGLCRALGASRREVFPQFSRVGRGRLSGGLVGLALTGLGPARGRALYPEYRTVAQPRLDDDRRHRALAILSAVLAGPLPDLARLPRAAGGAVSKMWMEQG